MKFPISLLALLGVISCGGGGSANTPLPVLQVDSLQADSFFIIQSQANQCYQIIASDTPSLFNLQKNTCDIYDRNQWFYRPLNNNQQLMHFATQTRVTLSGDEPHQLTNTESPSQLLTLNQQSVNENIYRARTINLLRSIPDSSFVYSGTPALSETLNNISVQRDSNNEDLYHFVLSNDNLANTSIRFSLNDETETINNIQLLQQANNLCINSISLSLTSLQPQSTSNENLHTVNVDCNSGQLQITFSIEQLDIALLDFENTLTITRVGSTNDATLSGYYTIGSGEVLLNFIRENPTVNRLIFNDLPGSIDDGGLLRHGRYIRAAGISTHMPANGQAYSGGVDLFLAGVNRTYEQGGILGVHAWSGGNIDDASDLADNALEHQPYIDYSNALLGSPTGRNFYFFTIKDGTDICIMTEAQLSRFNVITGNVLPTPQGVTPRTRVQSDCNDN